MTPVINYPDAVKHFVASGLFTQGRQFGPSTAIGFADENGGLVAGFVYHDYDPENGVIELSAFSTRRDWLNRSLLKVIFEYPFTQLGCRVAVARHSEKNTRVIRIWRALGATQTKIPELWGPNEAAVVAVLTRDAWHNGKFMR